MNRVKSFLWGLKLLCFYFLNRKSGASSSSHPLKRINHLPHISPIGVHLHVYHLKLLKEFIEHIQKIPCEYVLYCTTDTQEKKHTIASLLEFKGISNQIYLTNNFGRDILPWLHVMELHSESHEIWCHLHTKYSPHIPFLGKVWRHYLLDHLLGSQDHIMRIINTFLEDEKLGLIFPPVFSGVYNRENMDWGAPLQQVQSFFIDQLENIPAVPPIFPAGNMFWYRHPALSTLLNLKDRLEKLSNVSPTSNGSPLHWMERSLPLYCQQQGLSARTVTREK